jgi:hypothetical protein
LRNDSTPYSLDLRRDTVGAELQELGMGAVVLISPGTRVRAADLVLKYATEAAPEARVLGMVIRLAANAGLAVRTAPNDHFGSLTQQ